MPKDTAHLAQERDRVTMGRAPGAKRAEGVTTTGNAPRTPERGRCDTHTRPGNGPEDAARRIVQAMLQKLVKVEDVRNRALDFAVAARAIAVSEYDWCEATSTAARTFLAETIERLATDLDAAIEMVFEAARDAAEREPVRAAG